MFHGRIATIGLREQRMWIMQLHPEIRCCFSKRKGRTVLVCRGSVQPTPMNASYRVRIEYGIPEKPKVWVEEPKLRRRKPEERIPHTFTDDRPCLFRTDFRSDMSLATTIVPWLFYWLFFYESWLVTGEWQGGGVHPAPAELDEEAAA